MAHHVARRNRAGKTGKKAIPNAGQGRIGEALRPRHRLPSQPARTAADLQQHPGKPQAGQGRDDFSCALVSPVVMPAVERGQGFGLAHDAGPVIYSTKSSSWRSEVVSSSSKSDSLSMTHRICRSFTAAPTRFVALLH